MPWCWVSGVIGLPGLEMIGQQWQCKWQVLWQAVTGFLLSLTTQSLLRAVLIFQGFAKFIRGR